MAGPVRGKGPKHHGNGGLRAAGFKRNSVDLAVCPTTRTVAHDANDPGVRNLGYIAAELNSARFERSAITWQAAAGWNPLGLFLPMAGGLQGENPDVRTGFVKEFDNE